MTTAIAMETVLEEISNVVANEMAAEFDKASKENQGNPTALVAAIQAINGKVRAEASKRVEVQVKERKAKVEVEAKLGEVFVGLALDQFKANVWNLVPADIEVDGKPVKGKSLANQAEGLSTVPSIIIRMDRADAGKGKFGDPTILLGSVKTVSGNSGNTRVHKITVDGKEYATVAMAWKDVMGTVVQPTETVGGNESKTRKAAVAAFKAAGKTVTE